MGDTLHARTGHDHHACDCAAHRRGAGGSGAASAAGARGTSALWGTLLPVLACAVCPVCLSTYAKLFSVAGIGFGLSEEYHLALLVVAVGASVGVSAWRSRRTRRIWPLAIALVGSALVLGGHLLGEVAWMEWAGVLTLLAGGLTEHFRLRRLAASGPAHA